LHVILIFSSVYDIYLLEYNCSNYFIAMYENLFEIIKKNKLTDNNGIEKAIMEDWPLSKLSDFVKELYLSIEGDSPPPNISSLKDYHFLANSNMSGLHNAGCQEWRCRLDRINRLARFATLYSDSVYIQNYFAGFEHIDIDSKDPYREQHFRNLICGNIKIITEIEPLIHNGIIKFMPTVILLCSHCQAQVIELMNTIDSRINKQIKALDELYSKRTSAKLRVLSTPSPVDSHKYEIHVDCDEELFDHGSYVKIGTELPPLLRRKIDKKPSILEFQLSPYEILRGHVNTNLLKTIANDVSCLQFHRSNSNLKYLTDRTIDVSLLQATTEEEHLSKYNEILSNQLIFEMPVFQNISINSLLQIRLNEYDAFTSYRDTINDVISEYISQNKDISSSVAKQIYSDLIHPKLITLDKKIVSIRKSSIMKSLAHVVISTGSLTFGLCSGVISPVLQAALISLGLVEAVNTFKSLPGAIKTPDEIRNNNLYFLWKLSKKSKVI